MRENSVRTAQDLVAETKSSEAAIACDREWFDRKMALAKYLDRFPLPAEATPPESLQPAPVQASVWKKWGLVQVHDDSAPMKADAPYVSESSWAQVWSAVEKQGAVKPSSSLRADIQRLVFNDYRRLAAYSDMRDRDESPLVTRAATDLERCLELPSCSLRGLDAELLRQLRATLSYGYFVRRAEASGTQDDLQDLLQILVYSRDRFKPRKDPMVVRRGKVLELPLVDLIFGEQRSEFAAAMEKIWSSPELALRIKWQENRKAPEKVFRLVLGANTATKARDRRIQIEARESVRGMAHEIGHALGLPDEYSEVWDEKTCKYLFRQHTSGMMGTITGGTEAEMKMLQVLYPDAGAAADADEGTGPGR